MIWALIAGAVIMLIGIFVGWVICSVAYDSALKHSNWGDRQ